MMSYANEMESLVNLLLSFVSSSIGIDGRQRGKLDSNWMKLDPISRQFRWKRRFQCSDRLSSDKQFFKPPHNASIAQAYAYHGFRQNRKL